MAHVRRELALGGAGLLALAGSADGAQQDCSVALWWGGLDHAAKNDCDGDPRIEDINCVEGLNTLLKAVPTTAVGTVTQVVTGQDPAQLAFKTATGKDVPTFCDEVCTQGCYSGFWFHSPCVLDAAPVVTARLECSVPLGLLTIFLVVVCVAVAFCAKKRQGQTKAGAAPYQLMPPTTP